MTRSARILVVDDEPRYGTQLAEILRRDGHEVETAEDIVGALTTAQQFRPNVLLVDWMLKDRDTGLDPASDPGAELRQEGREGSSEGPRQALIGGSIKG